MSESALKLQHETLKSIQQKAVEAAGAKGKVEVLALPESERGERYLIVRPSGDSFDMEFADAPPPNRAHALHTLESLPDYLAYAIETLNAKPTVWYSEAGVVAVLDDSPGSFRRDRVEIEFTETPEFKWFAEAAEAPQTFSPKELVLLLRSTLSAALMPTSLELLKVVRNLSSSTSTTAASRIESHRESLGRDIENEVRSDAGEIPEGVDFRVRVLTDPLLSGEYVIKCLVEIEPRTLQIQLLPRPEDLRNAVDQTLESVGAFLKQQCADSLPDCHVFFGAPARR